MKYPNCHNYTIIPPIIINNQTSNWIGVFFLDKSVYWGKGGNHPLDVTEEASFEQLGFSPAPDLVTYRNGIIGNWENYAGKSNGDSDDR